MTSYQAALAGLQQQMLRKAQLEQILQELYNQRNTLRDKTWALEQEKRHEQADVDRLEGHSLAAFFYYVIGRKEEKLDEERQQAYAAAVKYDTARRELDAVAEDIQSYESELDGLRDCKARYAGLLREKGEALKNEGGAVGEERLRLEEQLAALETRNRELREAQAAGRRARDTADSILSDLDNAEGWGVWDVMGGGLIADLAKHNHLDQAQRLVERLQVELRRFRTELADVQVFADVQVSVDGFLRFADFFFDGLFADWTVMDHISRAQSQVRSTRAQIQRVLNRLEVMLRTTEQEAARAKTLRDEHILAAEI